MHKIIEQRAEEISRYVAPVRRVRRIQAWRDPFQDHRSVQGKKQEVPQREAVGFIPQEAPDNDEREVRHGGNKDNIRQIIIDPA